MLGEIEAKDYEDIEELDDSSGYKDEMVSVMDSDSDALETMIEEPLEQPIEVVAETDIGDGERLEEENR